MNATRLFILGALARHGPMHGHQIRRTAEQDRSELWADVKPGALYGALHRLEGERLIEAVRTEQEGRRPARTVYAITEEGWAELRTQRERILQDARLRPDPVDLALVNTEDMDGEQLRAVIEDRRRALAARLSMWQHLRESAAPYLTEIEGLTFRHTLLRLEAELTWHDELLAALPKLVAGPPAGTGAIPPDEGNQA